MSSAALVRASARPANIDNGRGARSCFRPLLLPLLPLKLAERTCSSRTGLYAACKLLFETQSTPNFSLDFHLHPLINPQELAAHYSGAAAAGQGTMEHAQVSNVPRPGCEVAHWTARRTPPNVLATTSPSSPLRRSRTSFISPTPTLRPPDRSAVPSSLSTASSAFAVSKSGRRRSFGSSPVWSRRAQWVSGSRR